MANTLFYIIVSIILFDFFFDRFLDYLNLKRWSVSLPAELEGIYSDEKYRESMNYFRAKQKFSLVMGSFSLILLLFVLFINGFALLDEFVRSVSDSLIIRTLLFFGVIGLIADLLSTPFSLYNTFVIEGRYGFNKTTVSTFIFDKLKSWFLAILIGGTLLGVVVAFYEYTGKWFWLVAWGVISMFTLFMVMFYSNIIVPLFNKQKPLEEGTLRMGINEFAVRTGFKVKDIFIIDGSKRSSKANAYFTGLGPRKRIVLYDTLINDHPVDELVAVLAHEIGHYKRKHNLTGSMLSLAQTGLLLYILSVFINNPLLSQALGASNGSFYMGLLAFGLLFSPVNLVLSLFTNYISRRNEYAADRFAGENYNPDSLISALKRLSVNNLSNLMPHPLFVFFHYSHPPLLSRIKSLKNI